MEQLKQDVYRANLALRDHGLVVLTWGNASAIDRQSGLVVIKPSGVEYDAMTAADMAVVGLDGNTVEGRLRPSSDTPTHLALYRAFPQIGAVIHTHSRFATVWAQTGRDMPAYGTTHADGFYGPVPCTRRLTPKEIAGDYEKATGEVITERFRQDGLDPAAVPAALVHAHGPFVWGKDCAAAVAAAVTLEEVACMAWHTVMLNGNIQPMQQELLDRHYFRKHGDNSYYGQK
ncbi:MAG: L-ribulose-5-phosphate 4-epimerase [Oscillospiraceae bacterium]|nr:L-ribulose-5-phosphate 4-epimerase [Oscillospiraceae bacterium]